MTITHTIIRNNADLAITVELTYIPAHRGHLDRYGGQRILTKTANKISLYF